ncbi:MAG TPA: PEP-CTERM sorting domain-containing protein, partial [Pirellulales bacterium]|nr:PEP-CTERM sorting domain-containing protein [Pirellulales bacterium]
VDGTLWMGDNNFVLHQFSQSGTALQTIGYTLQGSWYGMEFDTTPVPEPSTLVLAAVSFVGLAAWNWRRRR